LSLSIDWMCLLSLSINWSVVLSLSIDWIDWISLLSLCRLTESLSQSIALSLCLYQSILIESLWSLSIDGISLSLNQSRCLYQPISLLSLLINGTSLSTNRVVSLSTDGVWLLSSLFGLIVGSVSISCYQSNNHPSCLYQWISHSFLLSLSDWLNPLSTDCSFSLYQLIECVCVVFIDRLLCLCRSILYMFVVFLVDSYVVFRALVLSCFECWSSLFLEECRLFQCASFMYQSGWVTGWLSTCESKREQFYGKYFVLPYITEYSMSRTIGLSRPLGPITRP
jgi:hypothetical protein